MASGLFADYDLVVEILDPPPPPGTTNAQRVANGGADFCLTGVTYFLAAQKEAGDHFPARFVSVIHQRSPLGAIVAESSGIRAPADLAGRRLGRTELTGWQADELVEALADRGVGAPICVDLGPVKGPDALGRGDIDIVATFVDATSRVRAKGGLPVRAVHVGGDIYASGLVAADHLPTELVERMRAAVGAAFQAQRDDPEAGIADFCQRFPEAEPAHARESWALLEPYAFADGMVGAMDVARWESTIDWLARVHWLPPVAPERVYRPDLAAPGRSAQRC